MKKRKIKLYANDCGESIEIVKELTEMEYDVYHIFTGSTKPILEEDNGQLVVGYGNILRTFNIIPKDFPNKYK